MALPSSAVTTQTHGSSLSLFAFHKVAVLGNEILKDGGHLIEFLHKAVFNNAAEMLHSYPRIKKQGLFETYGKM